MTRGAHDIILEMDVRPSCDRLLSHLLPWYRLEIWDLFLRRVWSTRVDAAAGGLCSRLLHRSREGTGLSFADALNVAARVCPGAVWRFSVGTMARRWVMVSASSLECLPVFACWLVGWMEERACLMARLYGMWCIERSAAASAQRVTGHTDGSGSEPRIALGQSFSWELISARGRTGESERSRACPGGLGKRSGSWSQRWSGSWSQRWSGS